MNPELLIIQTGGTFDKHYPRVPGNRGYEIGLPAATDILQRVMPHIVWHVEPMFQLDSQDLTDTHRQSIAGFCNRAGVKHVVVIHGTDTMIKTAEYLATQNPLGITIVLTGAALPASDRNTDAEFNLGFACSSALRESPGVYVAMQARVYDWDKVTRDENGRFVDKAIQY